MRVFDGVQIPIPATVVCPFAARSRRAFNHTRFQGRFPLLTGMETNFRLWLPAIVTPAFAFYGVGFSCGNRRAAISGQDEYIEKAKAMMRAQGDSDEKVRTQIDLIRASKGDELGSDSLQYFAIWFPSVLVLINIVVTVIFELRKGKKDA